MIQLCFLIFRVWQISLSINSNQTVNITKFYWFWTWIASMSWLCKQRYIYFIYCCTFALYLNNECSWYNFMQSCILDIYLDTIIDECSLPFRFPMRAASLFYVTLHMYICVNISKGYKKTRTRLLLQRGKIIHINMLLHSSEWKFRMHALLEYLYVISI